MLKIGKTPRNASKAIRMRTPKRSDADSAILAKLLLNRIELCRRLSGMSQIEDAVKRQSALLHDFDSGFFAELKKGDHE
jgi:hypothetical protein